MHLQPMQGTCLDDFDLWLAAEEFLEDVAWHDVGLSLDAEAETLTADLVKKSGLKTAEDMELLRGLEGLEARHVRIWSLYSTRLQNPGPECRLCHEYCAECEETG